MIISIVAIGVAALVFDFAVLIAGIVTIAILFSCATYAHYYLQVPLTPLLTDYTSIEGPLRSWFVYTVTAYLILFSIVLYIIMNVIVKLTREKRTQLAGVSEKLSRYLSPQVYESIFSQKKEVRVGSEKKMLSVFVSDIKGFTQITDNMESEALTLLLNRYLDEMTQIALKYQGTIDKYIGDAIVIFFGDPLTQGAENDAVNCVAMAIEMRAKMDELQKEWSRQGVFEPLQIRIGINSGECNVGNFGSSDRLAYTLLGNESRLAEVLESSAPPNEILISSSTYELVKAEIECSKFKEIQFSDSDVETYLVLDFNNDRQPNDLSDLETQTLRFINDINFTSFNQNLKNKILNTFENEPEDKGPSNNKGFNS